MNKIISTGHSNIAIVKYWGKHGKQLPMNPSLSMTLQNAKTETIIEWKTNNETKSTLGKFTFENKENKPFQERIAKYIDSIQAYIPALKGLELKISSSNSFPHSTGIASSASAYSALAQGLVHIEKSITGTISGNYKNEKVKTSFLARLGSGSAARSIYKGFSVWGKSDALNESSDTYAIPINNQVNPIFKKLHDAILIVSTDEKKVGSSLGHSLMNNNIYAKQRFSQARKNTVRLINILIQGNMPAFCDLVEEEALALHAMMMTSTPPYLLLAANTIKIINHIQEFRKSTGIPICFTLDAGANVHLLYHENNAAEVKDLIESQLKYFCQNDKWISDKIFF